jgi:branched-chain amino acid transport system substrate-binding protein
MGLFLALIMVVLVGCSSSTPAPATSSAGKDPAANTKPIKLGLIIPATGASVEAGRFQKQGAELAVEEINKAGGVNGRPIKLVIEDDQSTNPGAVAALQKLLEDKEIPMIVSSIRSTQIQAMLPTINEAKIPVAIGGTNYGLTHSNSQWVFRFRPHDGMSAKVMVKFVVEELKKTKIAVVHNTDAFGNGGRDMVIEALKPYNLKIVSDQGFNTDEKDFTGVISALKQSGADAMVSYIANSPDLGILAKQMKQQNLNITWVGSPSITGQDGIKLAGDSLNGTYGIADYNADSSPKAKAYQTAYKAKYNNEEPDHYSAWSYDAVTIFAEVMKKNPDLKADALRTALLAIKGFQGAEGEYTFDKNGDGLDHYNIVQNNNNTFKLAKTLHVPRD